MENGGLPADAGIIDRGTRIDVRAAIEQASASTKRCRCS